MKVYWYTTAYRQGEPTKVATFIAFAVMGSMEEGLNHYAVVVDDDGFIHHWPSDYCRFEGSIVSVLGGVAT